MNNEILIPDLVLVRGDDTDFAMNQKLRLETESELNMNGITFHFQMLGIHKTFAPTEQGKTVEFNFSAAETKNLPCGNIKATIYLTDEANKRRTLTTNFIVYITTDPDEAYCKSLYIGKCRETDKYVQEGKFYLPVFEKNGVQYYRILTTVTEEGTGAVTTEVSEELYIKKNGKYIRIYE